jgi:hypothetical protein
MSSPETTGASTPSLARDWLYALRYWLGGRNGVIALVVLAVVIGGALNWSWLVAIGIAPLLITVLPCVAMCALGLCMNKMGGRSCSTEASSVETPKPDAQAMMSIDAGQPGPLLSDRSAQPDEPTPSPVISVMEPESGGKEPT